MALRPIPTHRACTLSCFDGASVWDHLCPPLPVFAGTLLWLAWLVPFFDCWLACPPVRYMDHHIAVAHLSDMRTQKECEGYIRDFCDPSNPCERLVMVVDIKEVPHAVLNNVRQMLDAAGDQLLVAHQRAVVRAIAARAGRGEVSGLPPGASGGSFSFTSPRMGTPLSPPSSHPAEGEGAEESKSGPVEDGVATPVRASTPMSDAGSSSEDDGVLQALHALNAAAADVPLGRKHVVIVVHCPSTWLHVRRATYPSLPLQGWRFVYADAHSTGSGVVSARSWMSAACGLQHSLGDGLSEQSLRAANEFVVNRVVQSVAGNRQTALSDDELRELGDDARMEVFYRGPATNVRSQQRLDALMDLMTVMGESK